MRDDQHAHPLAEQFRHFARSAERTSPLYGEICRDVAGDPGLLDLAAEAPPAQRRPNLLLAAVHYLLLSGTDHPLADLYPSVREWRTGRPPAAPARPAPIPVPAATRGTAPAQFRAFCREHRGAVTTVLRSRATQTNEVGRCAVLLPALATVAAARHQPLGLVDLGSSAGLNLLFDRYAYRYHPGGGAGATGAPVVIDCDVRAGVLPPLRTPAVVRRLGLDESPLAPGDPDDARWLLACQWPDDLGRFGRLRAALTIAASDPDPPDLRRADMVDGLASAATEVPDSAHLCVIHTWAAAYLSPGRQQALAEQVRQVARRRPVSWLFAELPFEVPGLPVAPAPQSTGAGSGPAGSGPAGSGPAGSGPVGGTADGGDRGGAEATALTLVEHDGTVARARRLADLHPHGRWVRWYG